jgi:hypothetical protein
LPKVRNAQSDYDPATAVAALCRMAVIGLASLTVLFGFAGEGQAQQIKNNVAVFAALDKVTARISSLEINMDETIQFGALKVTPRICYTRPATEAPKTSVFVEVDEIMLSGETQRIFTGWMFAQSPGLHAVEHPVFDLWLTNCKMRPGGQSGASRENSARPTSASSNNR